MSTIIRLLLLLASSSCHRIIFSSQVDYKHVTNNLTTTRTIDIKLGLLLGSQESKYYPNYDHPGRNLIGVFDLAISTINRLYSAGNLERINFKSIFAKTFGNENESIKKTIGLLTSERVNLILGPQENCRIESRLASVFNVAMISHHCTPHWSIGQVVKQPPSPLLDERQSTLIQTKPPSWKIVQRVVTLVDQLLRANNWLPQQMVLLYFKEVSAAINKRFSPFLQSSQSVPMEVSLANEALQYRLIGELLEIKLNELFSSHHDPANMMKKARGSMVTNNRKRQQEEIATLTVLNWHTTFYYGHIESPFHKIILNHLFQQSPTNQSNHYYSSLQHKTIRSTTTTTTTTATKASPNAIYQQQRETIYIVVGNYDAHLGLMSALNELNLLEESSVVANQQRQQSVVIGVNIEPYDERDDSVHFLRGLLWANVYQRQPAVAMYRRYIGVMPTRTRRSIQDPALVYNNNNNNPTEPIQHHHHPNRQALDDLTRNETLNQTLDSIHPLAKILLLARLPAEAFYLYDSILLAGAYFNDCIRLQKYSLEQCSEGNRMFVWFQNRTYNSSLNDQIETSFDEYAQAEGLYKLIGLRVGNGNGNESLDLAVEETPELVPIGKFVDNVETRETSKLELLVERDQLDSVWLPLWCLIRNSNQTGCKMEELVSSGGEEEAPIASIYYYLILLILIVLILLLCLCYKQPNALRMTKSSNAGWFLQSDQRNFLLIVHKYLLSFEIMNKSWSKVDEEEEIIGEQLVDLHCHMFQFPSCKFVHWLIALHQLKEMMFKYQTKLEQVKDGKNSSIRLSLIYKMITNFNERGKLSTLESFFSSKHEGTNCLRLLLNKYKSINETLCNLTQVNHGAVVKLYGVLLSYRVGDSSFESRKLAQLVIERSVRGNLREALEFLKETLDLNEIESFKQVAIPLMLSDILNGLAYLHSSSLQFHGELRITTCLVNSNWRLKLSGFHSEHMRRSLGQYEQKNLEISSDSYMNDLVYMAPEILHSHNKRTLLDCSNLRSADFYSFAFLLYELLVGFEPWSCLTKVCSKLIVERVKVDSGFRPPLSRLDKPTLRPDIEPAVICNLIRCCWSESPDRRPKSVESLRIRLSSCGISLMSELSTNLRSNNSAVALECYTKQLDKVTLRRKKELEGERRKVVELQLELLPNNIVRKLCNKQSISNRKYDCVSICIFKLTLLENGEHDPLELLNELLIQLDNLTATYHNHLHLVDSQVDSSLRYMVYAGEPLLNDDDYDDGKGKSYELHSQMVASFALQLIDLFNKWQGKFGQVAHIKCGLHCGPLLGGLLLGSRGGNQSFKFKRYILFGSALQITNALESTSLPQRIQISPEFRSQLYQNNHLLQKTFGEFVNKQEYIIIKREGKIYTKLTGEMDAYWLLNGPRLTASQSLMLAEGMECPNI